MELTPQEKEVLRIFADDKVLFPTIRTIVEAKIEDEIQSTVRMTVLNFNQLSNEEAGARLRASTEAMSLVEKIFASLAQYRTPLRREYKTNPAR